MKYRFNPPGSFQSQSSLKCQAGTFWHRPFLDYFLSQMTLMRGSRYPINPGKFVLSHIRGIQNAFHRQQRTESTWPATAHSGILDWLISFLKNEVSDNFLYKETPFILDPGFTQEGSYVITHVRPLVRGPLVRL